MYYFFHPLKQLLLRGHITNYISAPIPNINMKAADLYHGRRIEKSSTSICAICKEIRKIEKSKLRHQCLCRLLQLSCMQDTFCTDANNRSRLPFNSCSYSRQFAALWFTVPGKFLQIPLPSYQMWLFRVPAFVLLHYCPRPFNTATAASPHRCFPRS